MQIKSFNDIRNLFMLFSLPLLVTCSKGGTDNDMKLFENLDSQQSTMFSQWVNNNGLSMQQFNFNESGFSGDYSVLIVNNQIVGLKSKAVRSAGALAALPSLKTIEISVIEDVQLSQCNPQLEYLRINGSRHQSLSLAFLQQCSNLTELQLFYMDVTDWSALFSLNKLQKLSIRYSNITNLAFNQTLPTLSRLDLTNNQINTISFNAPLPNLKKLFLSNNQLAVLPDLSALESLETLSLDNNPLMVINQNHLPTSLRVFDARKTMVLNLEPLENLPNLQRIQVQRKPKNLPPALVDKVVAAERDDSQLVVAQDLMQKYLAANNFIEKLPKAVSGKALGLHKESQQDFSHSGTSKLTGTIEIDEIQGMMRIPLAQTDNLLYQQRQVKINGQLSVEKGLFRIYSPLEVNFWQMASLFVDNPQKEAPANSNLSIKGFIFYEAQPGQAHNFQANLIPMADRYLLLVGSDIATGVKITYQ